MAEISSTPGVTQAQFDALAATVPTASSTTPPAVSDSGPTPVISTLHLIALEP